MNNQTDGIVIRFEQSVQQTVGETSKIMGLVKAKYLISLITDLNLNANPRDSKTGSVTDAIEDSIEHDKDLFPFKTKGILLASSSYEKLDRGRVRITIDDTDIEGILDGGHNTLAIGILILKRALQLANVQWPRGQKTWAEFKDLWNEYQEEITAYQEALRPDAAENNDSIPTLSFYVPVELLIPADPDDEICMSAFKNNLLDICAARNNNAQLTIGAKANQKGYFSDLERLLTQSDPTLAKRIEWKTNDGGDINVQDFIALAWIPLSQLPTVNDQDGKRVDPPAPQKIYSGKGSCLSQFERFMSSPSVTNNTTNDYKAEMTNIAVNQAFKLAIQIPRLYDYIYEKFPDLYNAAGGSYGRIGAVKKLNERRINKSTPFMNRRIDVLSPDGFIAPLVYGLVTLIDPNTMEWRQQPQEFLAENLGKIVKRYSDVLSPWQYDPQKVGKAPGSYTMAADAYKMALAGIL
ncbi:MAG: hypothetical protein LKJ47_05745 [Bifidobacteriaceae bacterium]|nr:hypothetical protein [Bifidobacteriaceae bacterium]